ncbi:hypothetical protein AMK29_19285 [Streptomyces sp. CB02261]|nr:hypothetical protein AMK29_19285 [Streptomyces sp. CB02261]
MATVLTMSLTSAPRERPLPGLRRPWSTAPSNLLVLKACWTDLRNDEAPGRHGFSTKPVFD